MSDLGAGGRLERPSVSTLSRRVKMNASTKWYRANKHRPEVRKIWRERTAKWKEANREKWLASARHHTADYRRRNPIKAAEVDETCRQKRGRRNRHFIEAYKVFFGCSRCPEVDSIVLDLHHRNRNEKEFTISKWLWRASLLALAIEFEKCEVLCANCHRREHWRKNCAVPSVNS